MSRSPNGELLHVSCKFFYLFVKYVYIVIVVSIVIKNFPCLTLNYVTEFFNILVSHSSLVTEKLTRTMILMIYCDYISKII